MAFVFLPASYVASLAAGVPLVLLLKRLERLSFWWLTLPAIPLGAAVLTIWRFLMLAMGAVIKGHLWLEVLRFVSVGGVFGLAVASLFCLVVGIPPRSGGRGEERPAR